MCPRNESDLGHRLSLVMNFKTLAKKLLAVRPKTVLGIRKRKKRMAITKRFALHANTTNIILVIN